MPPKKKSNAAPDLTKLISGFEHAYDEAVKNLGRFNLVLFGETGIGKSTLVNAIFGEVVAPARAGRPVTPGTEYYEHPSGVLGVYDTKGIETGRSEAEVLKDLKGTIAERRDGPLDGQIHVIWYCLNAKKLRWEDSQARFIRALADEGIPVILVLTQVKVKKDGSIAPNLKAVIDAIVADKLPLRPSNKPFLTMAEEDEWDEAPAHGLQELLDATFRVAPDSVTSALNAAQKIDVSRKRAEARTIVVGATATAAAAGATPIPFADAALLVPIQTAMMAKVAAVFGLGLKSGTLATIAAAALSAGGVTTAGKYLATSLLKFVPGAGTVAGGAIRAAVASALTYSVGEAWMAVCITLHRLGPDAASKVPADEIKALFMDEFKKSAKRKRPK